MHQSKEIEFQVLQEEKSCEKVGCLAKILHVLEIREEQLSFQTVRRQPILYNLFSKYCYPTGTGTGPYYRIAML